MSVESVKNDIQSVLNRVNRIELVHGGCNCYHGDNKFKTNSTISSVEKDNHGGYYLNMYNDNLKIGGEDDDDENDSTLEDSLFSAIRKEVVSVNKDIEIIEIYGQEKGYFSIRLALKSEASKNKSLKMINEKILKLELKLREFNKEVAIKISQQKSKKKTCTHCDSNVNIDFIKDSYNARSHLCPVCHKPMYTDTELKKLKSITDKISELKSEIQKFIA